MLNIDKFFHEALRRSGDVMEAVDGRIFNPARPEIDEEEDLIPYLIITYDGGQSDTGSKDDNLSRLSSATVSILCCAEDRQALADLTELVEGTIAQEFATEGLYDDHDEWAFYIDNAMESAGPVQFDAQKPCCFQTLTYQCETSNR